MKRISSIILTAIMLLGGCAEGTSIYHNRPVLGRGPLTLTTDAYQRSLIITPENTKIRVCAEAAPDTFSVLSASLAAEGDVVKKSARIAAAINQSGAVIERTQTINLLRESMYRTCERYLSGGISRETLIVQAARDQRAMVAVLAIEQLSRTVRPAATVISAATTSATISNPALTELIVDLRKDETSAKQALGHAATSFATAGGPATCATARPADDTGVIKQAAWDACDTAKTELATRKADADTASGRVEKALALGGTPIDGGSSSASTGAGPHESGGGEQVASAETLQIVSAEIKEIANAPGIDESLMFCIGYLDEHAAPDKPVRDGCMDIIARRAAVDEAHAASLFGDTTAYLEDVAAGRSYRAFNVALLDAIRKGTDASVAPSVANFEKDAGLTTGLPQACTTRAKCLNAAADAYVSEYPALAAKLESALAKWK